MAEVVFLDTNVLLNVLDVPGKNSDRAEVVTEFRRLRAAGATLIIPIAAVVEVGNHLAQLAGHERQDRSRTFAAFLRASIDGAAPWVVSGASWDESFLRALLDGNGVRPTFEQLCASGVGSGDTSILLELQRYRSRVDLPSELPDPSVDVGPPAAGLRLVTPPPTYPRTPYLWPPPGREVGDDRLVPPEQIDGWLTTPVLVEEKLDGANVSLWLDDDCRLQVASRGGAGAQDRAGQLGRLRAWAAERDDALRVLLAGETALYGEWLWLTHGTAYDALPDWLVVLDLWSASTGFLSLAERDARARASRLVVPPVRFDGFLGSEKALQSLFGPSAWAPQRQAEGLVLRAADGRRCKVVDSSYLRRTDEQWAVREHNALAAARGAT